jgi:hypothetical protein
LTHWCNNFRIIFAIPVAERVTRWNDMPSV